MIFDVYGLWTPTAGAAFCVYDELSRGGGRQPQTAGAAPPGGNIQSVRRGRHGRATQACKYKYLSLRLRLRLSGLSRLVISGVRIARAWP